MVETRAQSASPVSKEISQSVGEKGEVSRSILPQFVEKSKEPSLDDPVSASNVPLIRSKRKISSSVDAGPSRKNRRVKARANWKISVEGFEVPEVQDWEYMIKPEYRIGGKPMFFHSVTAIDNIRRVMNTSGDHVSSMFEKTYFGYFLNQHKLVGQGQLIHHFLLREVKQPNPDEMWFKIGGKLLRFGIQEFAIATDLLCVGDTDKTIFETKRVRLFDKYFKKYPRFDKVALEDAFLNGSFETNEDLVNIVCLYLIGNYLFGNLKKNLVSKVNMEICDQGQYEHFPWGKELFRDTLKYLKSGLKSLKDQKNSGIIEDKHVDSKRKGKKKVESSKGKKSKKRKSVNEKDSYKLIGFPLAFQIWAYDCFDKLVGTVCYKTASKIPHILNFFCDVSPYFEELEKNVFEADEISVQNVVRTVEEITKYRLNELPKRVQQPVLESLGNVAAARDVDVDFVDNPSKVLAPPKDLIKGSIDLMKKDFDAKFDILLTMLTKCQEKLGIDAVACPAGPINQVVDHSPNLVGDDDMGMAYVPCSDNERTVKNVDNDNVSKNTLMDIDVPMEEENKEETSQVDEADKNSKDNDEDKADVLDVNIVVDDVITPDFIPDGDLLEVEGVDSVNELKDAVKDGDEEGKDTEENKEEEEEDNDNDNKDEGKHDENDKDGPDNGAGKSVDKFANDGNEDETDGSHNIADKGVDNSAKKDVTDDKGSDDSSKDSNEENIDICDPIAEKV
ncbi:hypothetical protein TorRG33x02_320770 [Trema orientale]|uniref:DUF1985 domain-containing protein n=1 Tax=Trema orientale TaxID=63057 RepID=A0A2P5BHU3_TREOI|nr:hypothetical protein TorRG33x02_320770 [Trema orientale]